MAAGGVRVEGVGEDAPGKGAGLAVFEPVAQAHTEIAVKTTMKTA